MKRIRNLLVFTALFISLNHAESIRAQDLEVVFKNSLWGAGIGALVAVTSWALAEEQESDELRKNLIQYSAVGVIGGMGYGFFRISQGGGGSGMGGMFSSRGAANLLTRLTAFLAAGFMATSLILTVLTSRQDRDGSILEEDQFDQQKEEFELEGEVQENTNNEESDNKPSVPVEK